MIIKDYFQREISELFSIDFQGEVLLSNAINAISTVLTLQS